MRRRWRGARSMGVRALVLAMVMTAAGCRYASPPDDPVSTALGWFAYVGAVDIRRACAPGAPDRLRFVYNGLYDVEVRTYDVVARGGRMMLETTLRGGADLAGGIVVTDPLAPWRPERGATALSGAEVAALRAAVEGSGIAPPAVGLRLASNAYWWLAASCRDGDFRLNAWTWPSSRFDALAFPPILAKLDPIDRLIGAPRGENERPDSPYHRFERDAPGAASFTLDVGRNGLVGYQ
ncbi:MAG: hypothetical protein FJX67_06165 [Alphaproteobacteria bacterium]|nr:hypothetical protein [Alphaproteobacteria bacterium]